MSKLAGFRVGAQLLFGKPVEQLTGPERAQFLLIPNTADGL
jgi:hypothetical protein